jgi:hypothetical protein
MKITVTQQHIDEGQRGSTTRDPISFAMADAGLEHPHAGVTYLSWQSKDYKRSVEIPREVYDFMADFDNGRPVQPFTFELESE